MLDQAPRRQVSLPAYDVIEQDPDDHYGDHEASQEGKSLGRCACHRVIAVSFSFVAHMTGLDQ